MGKTTYCNKVAYDWAINIKNEGDCFPEFEVVLLLKCRDVEIESDLWRAIDDQFLSGEIHQKEREKFFESIQQNQSKVLLILFGLDELPSSKQPQFYRNTSSMPPCGYSATRGWNTCEKGL